MSKIVVDSVERYFDVGASEFHALGPVDLNIESGEFLCIVGPSGCGKSTLLRIMAGLITPSRGEVAISQRRPGSTAVAMVFQDHGVYPWKTVEANVRLGLDLKGVPRKEAKARARTWLEKLHLLEFADSYPNTLSGGMRQRVSIARAMALEPEVLVMDEPFAALDVQLRALLQEELLALWQEDQRTVVFVTHSIDEAILLGDRVVVMSSRPGLLIEEFRVPFERPRGAELRGDPHFATLEQEIWNILRSQISIAGN